MATPQDIQMLLRFLSQDARIPLAQAMVTIKDLQKASLLTPNDIAKADIDTLKKLLEDDKASRQILNAAKRVSKKRVNSDLSAASSTPPAPIKRAKTMQVPIDPASFEASLELPAFRYTEEEIGKAILITNRAPLILAFAVIVLKYTMPEQPLSSRLSLAQAMCNAISQSKAKHIGIQKGNTAEEEGWGEGQPLVTVMNRQIRVMKRWGYSWKDEEKIKDQEVEGDLASTQGTVQEDTQETVVPDEPALWGVDLEALKRSNGPIAVGAQRGSATSLPIYRPEFTRAYLMKSFATRPDASAQSVKGKQKPAEEKERNLGMLLRSLDLLCQSWEKTLSKEDLDKRAWSWYCSVRPDVKSGAAGWGSKGEVSLAGILQLRRGQNNSTA